MPGVLLVDEVTGRLRARISRRPYWVLRYMGGRTLAEWDCDWSHAPAARRQSVRLYCPNGEVAELGNTENATGRLFQFKVAELVGGDRGTLAHVVGIVDKPDGRCRYAAWDTREQKLVSGHDNVRAMKFHHVGPLSFSALGLAFDGAT